ncbi:hypothetical protein ACG83_04130 [Frankia sp. R43]|uniref:hypothetical protein n=1 Tax=Frankia sp. R43 TaxID=269536 RepID=UPI0006CA4DA0|nr:hypothetical protein [Frankia sp. R43]KPM57005.1 hypothetical protein ACG83_04130 [Frankia sp. R43]
MPDGMSSFPARPAGRGVSALPLVTLRDCFGLLVAGPAPLALDGSVVAGLPLRMVALDELRDLLLAGSCPQAVRDTAWAVVIRLSRRDGGAWTVGAAGLALPALHAVCARLGGHSDLDAADVQAEVLTGFLEAVASVRLDLPRIAVRLRWAAYRAGLALTVQQREAPRPDADLFQNVAAAEQVESGSGPAGPEQVLADAVAAGVLTGTEADLIAATRLEDLPVSAWAARHATAPRQASRLRERAERRLVDHLANPAAPSRAPHPPAGEPPPRPYPPAGAAGSLAPVDAPARAVAGVLA